MRICSASYDIVKLDVVYDAKFKCTNEVTGVCDSGCPEITTCTKHSQKCGYCAKVICTVCAHYCNEHRRFCVSCNREVSIKNVIECPDCTITNCDYCVSTNRTKIIKNGYNYNDTYCISHFKKCACCATMLTDNHVKKYINYNPTFCNICNIILINFPKNIISIIIQKINS